MRRLSILLTILGLVLVGLFAGAERSRFDGASQLDALIDEIGPRSAHALDLFGSDEEEPASGTSSREAFWRTDSGIPEAQPLGIPTSFGPWHAPRLRGVLRRQPLSSGPAP
jgi:hypothetical protein